MSRNPSPTLTEISWQAIQPKLQAVNPKLADLLDKHPKRDTAPLYLCRYPYGSHLMVSGKFLIPDNQGNLVEPQHPCILQSIQENLSYSSVPFAIWLDSHGETYIELEKRVIPLHIFQPGSWIGLWELLDQTHPEFSFREWSVSIGARSLFALPKISNSFSLNKLRRHFNLTRLIPPKHPLEQIELFRALSNSAHGSCHWQAEIVIFSKPWLEFFQTDFNIDSPCEALRHFLIFKEWQNSIFWRNKLTFELLRQFFASAQEANNLKPNRYLVDTCIHLLSISLGAAPGFATLLPHQSTYGPIQFLQKALIEGYELKEYFPTIMAPSYLDPACPNQSIYYSLQIPTLFVSSPNTNKPHSVLDDLRMVKRLMEAALDVLKRKQSPLYAPLAKIRYDYYHYEADPFYGIQPASCLAKDDPAIAQLLSPNQQFCDSAMFMKGCVRMRITTT